MTDVLIPPPLQPPAPPERSPRLAHRRTAGGGIAPGERLLEWVLVLHPNPELAGGRAAQVQAAFPDSMVVASSRSTDALRSGIAPAGRGVVLVHLEGVERFQAVWGGDRLLARLRGRSGLEAVAWVAADDHDGHATAMAAGARGVLRVSSAPVSARSVPPTRLRDSLVSCVEGPAAVPEAPVSVDEPPLEAWFRGRYGQSWQQCFEPVAAVVVAGGERNEQAEALRHTADPPSTEQARRWLRHFTDVVCGEIRGNEAVQRREALTILRRIARERPIAAESVVARSLQRAARQLEADHTLALEAGLSEAEERDLIELARVEAEVVTSSIRRRGRPESGAWRLRRDLALGRVAERRGRTAQEKLDALHALREGIAVSLDAVHDAIEDRERPSPF